MVPARFLVSVTAVHKRAPWQCKRQRPLEMYVRK